MKTILTILSHVCTILSLMLLPLLVVDRFNPSMDFVNNDITKLMIAVLCVGAIVLSLLHRIHTRRNR